MWKTRAIFNLLLPPVGWNTITCTCLKSVYNSKNTRFFKKPFDARLSKEQISNLFNNQEALPPANISPLAAIDAFSGARRQNKAEAYYTRGRQNNCGAIYIAQNNIRLPRHTIRENAHLIILFTQDANILTQHALE